MSSSSEQVKTEAKALLLAAIPLAVYEANALRTRRVPTITAVVHNSPRWVRMPLASALAVAFSHLFFGRP